MVTLAPFDLLFYLRRGLVIAAFLLAVVMVSASTYPLSKKDGKVSADGKALENRMWGNGKPTDGKELGNRMPRKKKQKSRKQTNKRYQWNIIIIRDISFLILIRNNS